MKKIDKLLHKMQPAPIELLQLELNLDALAFDELCWFSEYLEKCLAGDKGSEQDRVYCDSLIERARKAARNSGAS